MANIGGQLDWKILDVFFNFGDSTVKYSFTIEETEGSFGLFFFFPPLATTTLEVYYQCFSVGCSGFGKCVACLVGMK